MSEQLFDVIFFGILQPGKDRDTAINNMAKLFKTEPARLKPYFSGARKVIKENINTTTAEKYITALENIGLVVKLEQATNDNTSKPPPSHQAPASNNSDSDNNKDTINASSDISLAPVGADMIKNPKPVQAQKIADISHITLAEVGSNVLENPVKTIPQVIEDFSYLTLAETGTNIIGPSTLKQ